MDVVLIHDAPAGIRFATHRRGSGWVSEAAGLDLLISRLRPLVCFFGHHHIRLDGEVAGIRCIGLNRVHMPGNLVAINVDRRPAPVVDRRRMAGGPHSMTVRVAVDQHSNQAPVIQAFVFNDIFK